MRLRVRFRIETGKRRWVRSKRENGNGKRNEATPMITKACSLAKHTIVFSTTSKPCRIGHASKPTLCARVTCCYCGCSKFQRDYGDWQ